MRARLAPMVYCSILLTILALLLLASRQQLILSAQEFALYAQLTDVQGAPFYRGLLTQAPMSFLNVIGWGHKLTGDWGSAGVTLLTQLLYVTLIFLALADRWSVLSKRTLATSAALIFSPLALEILLHRPVELFAVSGLVVYSYGFSQTQRHNPGRSFLILAASSLLLIFGGTLGLATQAAILATAPLVFWRGVFQHSTSSGLIVLAFPTLTGLIATAYLGWLYQVPVLELLLESPTPSFKFPQLVELLTGLLVIALILQRTKPFGRHLQMVGVFVIAAGFLRPLEQSPSLSVIAGTLLLVLAIDLLRAPAQSLSRALVIGALVGLSWLAGGLSVHRTPSLLKTDLALVQHWIQANPDKKILIQSLHAPVFYRFERPKRVKDQIPLDGIIIEKGRGSSAEDRSRQRLFETPQPGFSLVAMGEDVRFFARTPESMRAGPPGPASIPAKDKPLAEFYRVLLLLYFFCFIRVYYLQKDRPQT